MIYARRNHLPDLFRSLVLTLLYIGVVFMLIEFKSYSDKIGSSHDTPYHRLSSKDRITINFMIKCGIPGDLSRFIFKQARYENVDLITAMSVIFADSNFEESRITVDGNDIRIGLFGLKKSSYPDLSTHRLMDPKLNIIIGLQNLRKSLKKGNNNLIISLMIYKFGKTTISSRKIGKNSLDYIQRVLNKRGSLHIFYREYMSENSYLTAK